MPCTAIKDDTQRLACYDRALRPTAPATPAPAADANVPTAAPSEHLSTSREPRRERHVREAAAAPPPEPAPAHAARSTRPEPDAAAIEPIVVVEVHTFPGRGATFVTDSGAVWIQSDSRQTHLPSTPFKASLKPGAMSSVFLVPDDAPHAIRVHPEQVTDPRRRAYCAKCLSSLPSSRRSR